MRVPLLPFLLFAFVALGHTQEGALDREKRFDRLKESIGHTYDDTWRAASLLKLDSPVSDEQAWLLADAYFCAHISGCGLVKLPIDRGSYWSLETLVGIGARNGPEIRVDKKTGTTLSKGHPKVTDPTSYRKLLRSSSKN